MSSEFDTAYRYRVEHGYIGKGGVIMIFEGVPTAWVRQLDQAHHWCPDVIAIDEDGFAWIATGGSEEDGAKIWLPFDLTTGRRQIN